MAVQIQYDFMRRATFNSGLSKLMSFPRFSPRVALSIARVIERVEKEREVAQKLYDGVLKKHAVLDEKGEVKPKEGQPNSFEIAEHSSQEAFNKEIEEMGKETFSVEMSPILIDKLDGVGLSANEIAALEPILDLGEAAAPSLAVVQ